MNETSASLSEVLITDNLGERPFREPNYELESQSLKRLGRRLAVPDAGLLQELTDIILDVCRADSAGISIFEKNGDEDIFRWHAISGQLKPFLHGTMPAHFSPCGVVLDRKSCLLIEKPIRYWRYIEKLGMPLYEVLLVPFFQAGVAVGTLWAVSHRPELQFDSEDKRQLTSLSEMASSAVECYFQFKAIAEKHDRLSILEKIQGQTLRSERSRRSTAEQEQRKIESIFSQSKVPMAVFEGPDHQFVITNSAFNKTFGVLANPVGKKISEVFPEASSERFIQLLNHVYTTGQTYIGQEVLFKRLLPDGSEQKFYLDFTYAAKRDEDNQVEGLILTVVDVTDRVIAKQKVEASEHLLAMTANSIPALICYIDHNFVYRFVNSAYETWFGHPPSHYIGRKLEDVVGEKVFQKVKSHLERTLQGEALTFEDQIPYATSVGGTRHIEASYSPDIDSDTGKVKGIVALAKDISEKKIFEKDLQNARVAAEKASHAKSAFLANMSHEIRSPLGAIMGFSELARQPGTSHEDILSYLSVVERNSVQVLRIIDDILDLAKVEAGRVMIENIEFSLSEFLADFTSLIGFRARENGILFHVKAETDLPEKICTDPTRLRQILMNSVGNAIKFTQQGSVTLHVSYHNGCLKFDILDTGRGISKEQMENLFQAFVQADESTTRKFGGTGLGLVLTKKLCQLLGGDYKLDWSALGEGSRFSATIRPSLPDTTKISTQNMHEFKPSLPSSPSVPQQSRLKNIKILLAEDSPDNQVLVKLFLEKQGAQLTIAKDGFEAIEKAQAHNFDVILMDIQMPNLDGHGATRRLRDQGYQKPIVALTAHAMKEEAGRAQASGFTTFLSKPIQREELIETVSKLAQMSGDGLSSALGLV